MCDVEEEQPVTESTVKEPAIAPCQQEPQLLLKQQPMGGHNNVMNLLVGYVPCSEGQHFKVGPLSCFATMAHLDDVNELNGASTSAAAAAAAHTNRADRRHLLFLVSAKSPASAIAALRLELSRYLAGFDVESDICEMTVIDQGNVAAVNAQFARNDFSGAEGIGRPSGFAEAQSNFVVAVKLKSSKPFSNAFHRLANHTRGPLATLHTVVFAPEFECELRSSCGSSITAMIDDVNRHIKRSLRGEPSGGLPQCGADATTAAAAAADPAWDARAECEAVCLTLPQLNVLSGREHDFGTKDPMRALEMFANAPPLRLVTFPNTAQTTVTPLCAVASAAGKSEQLNDEAFVFLPSFTDAMRVTAETPRAMRMLDHDQVRQRIAEGMYRLCNTGSKNFDEPKNSKTNPHLLSTNVCGPSHLLNATTSITVKVVRLTLGILPLLESNYAALVDALKPARVIAFDATAGLAAARRYALVRIEATLDDVKKFNMLAPRWLSLRTDNDATFPSAAAAATTGATIDASAAFSVLADNDSPPLSMMMIRGSPVPANAETLVLCVPFLFAAAVGGATLEAHPEFVQRVLCGIGDTMRASGGYVSAAKNNIINSTGSATSTVSAAAAAASEEANAATVVNASATTTTAADTNTIAVVSTALTLPPLPLELTLGEAHYNWTAQLLRNGGSGVLLSGGQIQSLAALVVRAQLAQAAWNVYDILMHAFGCCCGRDPCVMGHGGGSGGGGAAGQASNAANNNLRAASTSSLADNDAVEFAPSTAKVMAMLAAACVAPFVRPPIDTVADLALTERGCFAVARMLQTSLGDIERMVLGLAQQPNASLLQRDILLAGVKAETPPAVQRRASVTGLTRAEAAAKLLALLPTTAADTAKQTSLFRDATIALFDRAMSRLSDIAVLYASRALPSAAQLLALPSSRESLLVAHVVPEVLGQVIMLLQGAVEALRGGASASLPTSRLASVLSLSKVPSATSNDDVSASPQAQTPVSEAYARFLTPAVSLERAAAAAASSSASPPAAAVMAVDPALSVANDVEEALRALGAFSHSLVPVAAPLAAPAVAIAAEALLLDEQRASTPAHEGSETRRIVTIDGAVDIVLFACDLIKLSLGWIDNVAGGVRASQKPQWLRPGARFCEIDGALAKLWSANVAKWSQQFSDAGVTDELESDDADASVPDLPRHQRLAKRAFDRVARRWRTAFAMLDTAELRCAAACSAVTAEARLAAVARASDIAPLKRELRESAARIDRDDLCNNIWFPLWVLEGYNEASLDDYLHSNVIAAAVQPLGRERPLAAAAVNAVISVAEAAGREAIKAAMLHRLPGVGVASVSNEGEGAACRTERLQCAGDDLMQAQLDCPTELVCDILLSQRSPVARFAGLAQLRAWVLAARDAAQSAIMHELTLRTEAFLLKCVLLLDPQQVPQFGPVVAGVARALVAAAAPFARQRGDKAVEATARAAALTACVPLLQLPDATMATVSQRLAASMSYSVPSHGTASALTFLLPPPLTEAHDLPRLRTEFGDVLLALITHGVRGVLDGAVSFLYRLREHFAEITSELARLGARDSETIPLLARAHSTLSIMLDNLSVGAEAGAGGDASTLAATTTMTLELAWLVPKEAGHSPRFDNFFSPDMFDSSLFTRKRHTMKNVPLLFAPLLLREASRHLCDVVRVNAMPVRPQFIRVDFELSNAKRAAMENFAEMLRQHQPVFRAEKLLTLGTSALSDAGAAALLAQAEEKATQYVATTMASLPSLSVSSSLSSTLVPPFAIGVSLLLLAYPVSPAFVASLEQQLGRHEEFLLVNRELLQARIVVPLSAIANRNMHSGWLELKSSVDGSKRWAFFFVSVGTVGLREM